VRYLLQFPPNHRQVAESFEHVRNPCDIAATNCTEIAASLHLQFFRELERDKIALKSVTKIAQKIAFVNGP